MNIIERRLLDTFIGLSTQSPWSDAMAKEAKMFLVEAEIFIEVSVQSIQELERLLKMKNESTKRIAEIRDMVRSKQGRQ